jgi:hypothetical protein
MNTNCTKKFYLKFSNLLKGICEWNSQSYRSSSLRICHEFDHVLSSRFANRNCAHEADKFKNSRLAHFSQDKTLRSQVALYAIYLCDIQRFLDRLLNRCRHTTHSTDSICCQNRLAEGGQHGNGPLQAKPELDKQYKPEEVVARAGGSADRCCKWLG